MLSGVSFPEEDETHPVGHPDLANAGIPGNLWRTTKKERICAD
jgi:hypothetical protein